MNPTPIQSSFFGLVKHAACPSCGTRLTKGAFEGSSLCSKCGDYARWGRDTLGPLDSDAVAGMPIYAAPTPWPDMQCPTFGALMHPVAAIMDMALTKKEGVRLMEAKWPEGCCVCGRPAVRHETLTQAVGFSPPNGLKPRRDMQATVVAKGVPHCADHQNGARFERVISFGDANIMVLGIFFRSHAYQKRFRELNPWKWPG